MNKLFSLVFVISLTATLVYSQVSDAALKAVTEKDKANRSTDGKLITLTADEHLERGRAYFDNRQFPQSREHFQKIFDNYASDPAMSGALFMTGRSYYWERQYARAIPFLDRISREYPNLKDGREGLYFKGACHIRLGKNAEAAKIYEQYVTMYPTGERIDGAYLNAIDALRESNQYDAANQWVDRVRDKFAGQPTEANALHARLRMQIYRAQWADAEATAALTQAQAKFAGSMTSLDEIKYLRAFALEKAGRKNDAMAMYASIPDNGRSYFGGLAAEKVAGSTGRLKTIAQVTPKDFPAPYRIEILQYARKHKIDPRFVLAIMKQESTFRPEVKSPSAARGLLQLVLDTALKYNKKAGYAVLNPDDLYQPRINIAIGIEYMADLKGQFSGLYEAIAASYNGGEDNAARWLNRSKPRDPGIFASEVGFPETKQYVFKVMTNFRIYRDLYDENLVKR